MLCLAATAVSRAFLCLQVPFYVNLARESTQKQRKHTATRRRIRVARVACCGHAGHRYGWAIAVGVIMGVLLLALIAAAAFVLRRRRQRKQASPFVSCPDRSMSLPFFLGLLLCFGEQFWL